MTFLLNWFQWARGSPPSTPPLEDAKLPLVLIGQELEQQASPLHEISFVRRRDDRGLQRSGCPFHRVRKPLRGEAITDRLGPLPSRSRSANRYVLMYVRAKATEHRHSSSAGPFCGAG
jgi:hypothetical protein